MENRKKVLVVMGDDSDLPVVRPAFEALRKFDVEYEAHVCSAHRTPEMAARLSAGARKAGFGAIIAAAGKAAHLAGVMAAGTTLPVVGLPIKTSALEGMDALLSTVQMPTGVPVATVAINGAYNAALLCVQMLAICDGELARRLDEYKDDMARAVEEKDRKINSEGGAV